MDSLTCFLGRGRENALRADVLAARLQVSPRGLRSLIMAEREKGELILYSPGGHAGYFLPDTDPVKARAEIAAFCAVQEARCKHGLAALRASRRALAELDGQQTLDGTDE